MPEVVIASAVRTAVGRAHKGTLANTRPDELGAAVIRGAMDAAGISNEAIEDVIIGCAMPEGEQGMNMARICALRAGLPHSVPAETVNRFCSSGLQTIAHAAERVRAGWGHVILAGGAESMTMVPMTGNKPSPNPWMMSNHPEAYTSMGVTAELVAEKYGVSREDQDAFAVSSQQKAAAAIGRGAFADEIVPVMANVPGADPVHFSVDECPRPGTTIQGLARLRSPFKLGGTATAGNSSPLSDGAACSVVMSEDRAKELGITPLVYMRDFTVVGVAPELMGIGPAIAIPKLCERAGLSVDDIGLFEINEAFAAQAVYCVRDAGIDPAKVNVNGGAIALGHPLGATGAKLTATLIHEMRRRNTRYGVVSMCIGGGMGAAGLFELAT